MAEWFQNIVDTLGYPGITVLMIIETLFPPVASEIVMPLAGYVAGKGDLSFIGVIIAAMIGFLVGVLPLYFLGRYVSNRGLKNWLEEHGTWFMPTREDLERAEGWFQRHGSKIVIAAHILPGVRSLISIPAGMADMNLLKFLLYTLIGKGIWTTVLAYLGKTLGENYGDIQRYMGPISIGVTVLIVVAVGVLLWRRKRQQASQ